MASALRQKGLILLQRTSLSGVRTTPALSEALKGGFASDAFKDKERGEENMRFRKEDERLLRQLLNKVKKQADTVDIHEAASTQSSELAALKDILGKYNVSDADLQKVMEWKHA